MPYIVQSLDLLGFRDEFASNHPDLAHYWLQMQQQTHGNRYRIIKQ